MDPQKLTAQELVQLCLETNDEALWVEFVRRYRPLISGVIAKRYRRHTLTLPSPALIDDLTQDTYVKICANEFRALRTFDYRHENALLGFLKVVASNVVEDYVRRMYSEKHGSGNEDLDIEQVTSMQPACSGGAENAEGKILMEEIKKCLQEQASEANFTRDYAIFWLYYRHGLTAKAIAELPSIRLTVKGVESTLLRLTRAVRAKLAMPPSKKPA